MQAKIKHRIDTVLQLTVSVVLITSVFFLSACSNLPMLETQSSFEPPAVSLTQWGVISGGSEGSGIIGTRPVNLVRPVAVAALGTEIYIVDAGPLLLYLFDSATGKLTILQDLNAVVQGEVNDIFVSPDRSYYIADASRVLHFDRQGELIRTFEDRINLGRPVSVIENPATGWVYIADGFNDDVLVYNGAGQLQGAIGTRGDNNGQFRGITAMALGDDGLNVATRFGPSRVQHMGFDRSFLYAFDGDTVTFPTALAVDYANRVYVSDFSDNTIRVYANGHVVATMGGTGSSPGRFKHITDLWFDNGLLYVADSLNARVQIIRVVNAKP